MERRPRVWIVAALSLVFTWVFFWDYLPPFRRFYIPFDLREFHYALADYAFQALRQWRLPEWDAAIYCGIPFAANAQAALFYPPTWILFAANAGRKALSYGGLQMFVFAHVWLAFFLCYRWLRGRRLAELACLLGAGAYAFGGFVMILLQHAGMTACHAWMPLAFWGIDEAAERSSWRPLWKVATAGALCFLAGYPPAWFTFAACALAYAAWRWRLALGVTLALAASLLLAAVQLLPAMEFAGLKAPGINYGGGYRSTGDLLPLFLANFHGFGLDRPAGGEYRYLGAPVFLGLAALVFRRKWRDLVPALSVLAVSLVVILNPLGVVEAAVTRSSLLVQLCRDWYWFAGLSLAVVPLAAAGLDHLLRRQGRPAPGWPAALAGGLLAAWSVRQVLVWLPDGSDFPMGWRSALEPAVTLALVSLAVLVLPAQPGRARFAMAAAILLAVGADYKVFGTGRRFNAERSLRRLDYDKGRIPLMSASAFDEMRAHPEYRVALDRTAPFPVTLRHFGLATPQGHDPQMPAQYREFVSRNASWHSDVNFDIYPDNEAALRLFGVRYFITSDRGPLAARLAAHPDFRRLGEPTYFRVYEYAKARPPFGWEQPSAGDPVQLARWLPENREFVVQSAAGGGFTLTEQFFPGWQATVDGTPVPIERWNGAFQAVRLAPGEHRLAFRYRSSYLRLGAIISLVSCAALLFAVRWRTASA